MRSLCLLAVLLTACGDDAPVDPTPDLGTEPDASEVPVDAFVPEPDICDELELPRSTFVAATGEGALGAVAGDFSLETTEGTWTFEEEFTGCESYVFVVYGATSYGNDLWASVPDGLFMDGPRNVHYFIGSYEADPSARIETVRAALEEGFEFRAIPEDERAFWRSRIHFVTESLQEGDDSVRQLVANTPRVLHAFGIGRDQRFDPVGSLFEVRGGGFVPNLGMAAWAPHWYNYLAELEARLDAETGVTVLPLVPDETLTERVFDRNVTLPDAAAMADFDTLEVDVQVTCHLDPGGCSEWDRIAHIFLCTGEGDDLCAETRELVRWITPYSRPGRRRWVMDASPLLPLMSAGGERTLRIVMGPEWEEATERDVAMSLRLSTRSGSKSVAAELAFEGGNFDATYNEGRTPFTFTPPADATRVELVVLISGHGQTDGDNCAEWCNHTHTFTANGTPHVLDFEGEAGQRLGCAQRSAEGVVPGQWGNWAPLRAGWCPGLPVAAHRIDVTADVTPGEEATFTYEGSFAGGAPRGGNVVLSAYLVASR